MPLLPVITIITFYYVFEIGLLADVRRLAITTRFALASQPTLVTWSAFVIRPTQKRFQNGLFHNLSPLADQVSGGNDHTLVPETP